MRTQSHPCIGVGLRHPHYEDALHAPEGIDFVEFHAENLFIQNDLQQQFINDVKQHWPVSIHGTAFGLGSVIGPSEASLDALEQLVAQVSPMLISEHVCFNRAEVNHTVFHGGDLYPIPYNDHALDVLCHHIDLMQTRLQRHILMENLSAYLDGMPDKYSEAEFLSLMVQRTGCGLLLDLNNILINQYNQQSTAPLTHAMEFVEQLPIDAIQEIHLAGFTNTQVNGKYVDDHAQPVGQECWQLYTEVLSHVGCVPTLIEWDNNLPTWSVLLQQADTARQLCLAHLQGQQGIRA